jgi:hypothetical protein
MVRMQRVVCPACGQGHTFALPVGEPLAQAYGYSCPETGRPAAIGPQGQWQASEHPSQGAVALSPLVVAAEAPVTEADRVGGPAVRP